VNPGFLRANPSIVDKLKRVKGQNQRYLAHEYFNRDWRPTYFAEMAKLLEPAKLSFACPASFTDHISALNLTQEQLNFLKEIPDDDFRESVRDFIVNRQFRRDYWVKGARKLSGQEQLKELRKIRILLVVNKDDVDSKVKSSIVGANIQEAVFTPLMAALAQHQVFSLSELEISLQEDKVTMKSLVQAVMILISEGYVAIAQDQESVNNCKEKTIKFNQHILDGTEGNDDINFIVSPVTGSGVHVNRFERLFIKYIKLGINDPNEWSKKAWALLSSYNQRLLKDGKTLESDEENLTEILRQANEFLAKRVPIMEALQII
jgi:methyltransferase-like protein